MNNWPFEHPILTFLLAYTLLEGTIKLVNRILRTIKVLARGWPTKPNMDADGDIVLPEEPEK